MRSIDTIIEDLKALDLKNCKDDEITKLLGEMGVVPWMCVTLHPDKLIMRIRPNYGNEEFFHRKELTYKPKHLNYTYQRASTPQNTMFYGSIISDYYYGHEPDSERYVATLESLPWSLDKNVKGFQKHTLSRWRVKEDINILAIVHHDQFIQDRKFTEELENTYRDTIQGFTQENREKYDRVVKYISEEFAKPVKEHYEYKISALFSNIITQKGLDGVIYPSVQNAGYGYNVAITPQAADAKLELSVAGECVLYKNKTSVIVDNLKAAELTPPMESFILKPIDPKYHCGQAASMRCIGVHSADELKDFGKEHKNT